MALTDLEVKKAKATGKPVKLADSGGMYLLVQPDSEKINDKEKKIAVPGAKYWRLDYRFAGKRKTLAIGVYPDGALSEARERREEARKVLANGADPGDIKKAQKAAVVALAENSFELVAREWFSKHAPNWKENHSSKIIARLEKDVFPWIGAIPIAEINAPALLAAIRRIESRGALETEIGRAHV